MRFLFLIVFSLFLVCKAPAELAILPYLTSENDALSLVDGTVDAYNGKLVQKDVDIHILGSSPLELNRYYDGGHHYPGELGYGVGLSPPLLLTFQPDLKKQNVLLEQRSGSQIPCTVKKISKSVFYTGSVDPDFFKSGYTNCCEALLNGEPSLLSLHIEGTNHQFVVMLGDGTKRIYRFFNALNFNEFYRLVKEELPNGTERHYAYKNNHQLLLERIWTTASNGSLILNSVTFTYGNNRTALTASNGQYVCYEQRLKSGKAKRTSGLSSSSVRFSESVLAKVSSNYLPECHYEVLSRSHFTDTLFSFKEIKKADNRFVRADYDHQERVKHLWKSGIDVPAYTFEYHFGYTKVLDANRRSKRFEYDKRRLSKIVEEECAHHFKWDHKGQLVKQILTDRHGNSVVKREYQYDAKGNITEAKISGTILAKASQDCYVTSYLYGERNLLLSENHNQKQEITYCYLPNTNLIEKKLTFADGQFVEREFYQYDQNSILIQKIIDDGSTSEKEDLTNVSYRLITDIEPQLNPNLPGMTFPRLIKESYLDLKTGEKKLLKIIENIYCYGDLLSEEKTYDANGNYCYSRFFEYDKRRVSSETDALGHKTIYRYDENGNKIYAEKLGTEKRLQFVYDKADNLVHEIEHTDIALMQSHTYDAVGNRIKTKDAFGQETTFEYDSQKREISSTDPLGFTTKKEYDVQGNIIKEIDKDGYLTRTVYNIYKKPLEIIYPDGTTKCFCYNLQGHLIQQSERDGQFITYDVDYQGRSRSTKTYSPDSNFLKETKAVYKGNNLVTEIDAMGYITYYSYDGAGRLITKTQENQITSYEYDPLGNLFKTTQEDSVEIKIYDFLNRLVEERTEDPKGNIYKKQEFVYDIHGNQTLVKTYQDASHYTETKNLFNSRNEPVQTVDALGNEYNISYRYSDHLEKETIDPLGRKTLEIFDILNRLSALQKFSATGDLLSQSCFAYDGRGNKTFEIHKVLAQNQDYNDYVIQTSFDAFNQKTSEKEQNDKITSYTYQNGRLHSITQPNGTTLNQSYDALGRLLDFTSTDGTIHYRYTYDLNDNLLKSEDLIHNLTTERFYDALNNLIKEKQATGFEISYSYDSLNRLGSLQFEDEKITYSYSPTSVLSASRYKNNELLYSFTQETDWKGNVINQTLPGNLNISCSFDALDRCSHITSDPFQQSFTYDKVNNLIFTSVKDPLGTYQSHFSYDDLNQITEESGLFDNRYLFDSLNNRRSLNEKIHVVNNLNQLTSDSEEEYTYDKNGNRLSKENTYYKYDALNRLISISTDNNTIHYKYDSFGRRIEETSADKTVHYLYQFDTEIAALVNNEIVQFRALYDEFSAFAIELENKIYTPIRNHRGDTCILVDAQNDAVSTYRYDAFGTFTHTGSIKCPWLLSGQRYDETIKLYHFQNRDYDPFTGRWLTTDPLGFADGPNLYAYVHNNPLIYVDPYGLWAEELYQYTKEIGHSTARGFIDDTSFDASSYILGEHQTPTIASKAGYYLGTGTSMLVGVATGGTLGKAAKFCGKGLNFAYKSIKTALTASKNVKTLTASVKAVKLIESEAKVQKACQWFLKPKNTSLIKEGIASTPNSNHKILQLENKISDWLGKETKMIKNKNQDVVFLSKDMNKRVRFDLNHPHPHSNPHGHVEEFVKEKWNKSGPVYPRDVPRY